MTTSQKGRIFISYCRADSAGYAGRIYDRLTAHFGKEAVFMDVDTIEAGLDFVAVLQNAVQSCDVLVALIGRSWLDIKDEAGKRRLDNPEDFVRVEIAAALDRDIRVIPVLVDGMTMPRSTELPDNLAPLARRNALQVEHHSFNADAYRLIAQLELALEAAEDSRILKARRLQEEQERKEKEALEKERRERIAWEKAEAEEKARKATLRKARQQETRERIKNIFRSGNKRPYFVGGGIVILVFLGYIIRSNFAPSTPIPPTETSATTTLPSATSKKPPTEVPFTPTSTDLPTEIPLTPTPTLNIGSTMISEKDGMTMVYVPAGEFQMGSENGAGDEKPVHTVYLDAFWIDQTEVTNGMYAGCVDAGECNPPGLTSDYGNSEFDDYPVLGVSWNYARAYCEWAERRLPSEAEWEKAAGWDEDAGAQRVYPWGNNFDGTKTNFCDTNCLLDWKNTDFNDGFGDTAPIGSYPAGSSFYGAYDMAGNVLEWVSDLYGSDYYANSPSSNPTGPDGGASRVTRGGSWYNPESALRSASRGESNPTLTTYGNVGFRCARSATP